MAPAPPPLPDIDGVIEEMWTSSTKEIADIDPGSENWKTQVLPLARIKKIMKSEEAVYAEMERDRQEQQARANGSNLPVGAPTTRFMIAGEAPILLGKACELLVKELTVRAWRHTERNRRRTLQRQDVHAAVGESEVYDFLIDIVPRIAGTTTTTSTAEKNFAAPGNSAPEATGGVSLPAFGNVINAPQAAGAPAPPPGQQSENNAMSLSDAEARYAQMQQVQEQIQDQYMMMQQASNVQPGNAPAAPAGAGQAAQPQNMMLNANFSVQGSDPNAAQIGLGQWGLPMPTNGSNPPAPGT